MVIKIFYFLKPFIPRHLQIAVRRILTKKKLKQYENIWPIDPKAGEAPGDWEGWPDGRRFAIILTHDVDTQEGHDKCYRLLEIEEKLGFRSSFNFVLQRYDVDNQLLRKIVDRGFEIGIHGLNHDGKLYNTRKIFGERAAKINQYIEKWGAVGFRSPAMHHNLDWIHDLNIKYDASTFDTDPFEPQSDGVGTIFPFWVKGSNNQDGYLELPYTLPQDHLLFIILEETNSNIWKQKLDWIAQKGGMALLNTHPDYMNFGSRRSGLEEYPVRFYEDFLKYVKNNYEGQYWHVLPREISCSWSKISENINRKY